MATFVFETISATDASTFTSDDRLLFQNATVGTLSVTDNPATTSVLTTTVESFTLSNGTHSATFSAAALSGASTAGNLVFVNGDELVLGSASTQIISFADAGHGHATKVYAFDGNDTVQGTSAANDTIDGGGGNDMITGSSSYTDAAGHFTENDFYMGGAGDDVIHGGTGNDHIYGNLISSTAGAADGADGLFGGLGNDYVQGNGGDDSIHGNEGNDRLYGGAGVDIISGDDGNDYLQGNKGADTLRGGNDSDTIHGGADNDLINGDAGNDQVFGDAGNDTVSAGAGFDTLWGGDGDDTFRFSPGDDSNSNVAVTVGANAGLTDVIADFTGGADVIKLPFAVATVLHQANGITLTTVDAAQTYAQGLLDAHTGTHEVAAVTVGHDTYLFYNSSGNDGSLINQAVKVLGVTGATFHADGSDFV
ncbi:MAG TPA: calcium-binding protein [Sphingomonas sp.]|uniref:calcium-binding protein n=1 Tax=Sphingomonas sp. TaxID=28214 RepID=UPI002B7E4609|nr:calcium-binding protein [Sphingomonas sp.]HMI20284.1 calcium-binding protein [Sphingomonas sp.]